MIALIQRVLEASVEVDRSFVGVIGPGILAFVGVQREDNETLARRLFERIIGYRIFADGEGRMNRSLVDISGELLLVPQFTLAADTSKGARPSFSSAAPPEKGEILFDYLVTLARERHPQVATGRFGANMKVHLVNNGPVTFWLEV